MLFTSFNFAFTFSANVEAKLTHDLQVQNDCPISFFCSSRFLKNASWPCGTLPLVGPRGGLFCPAGPGCLSPIGSPLSRSHLLQLSPLLLTPLCLAARGQLSLPLTTPLLHQSALVEHCVLHRFFFLQLWSLALFPETQGGAKLPPPLVEVNQVILAWSLLIS